MTGKNLVVYGIYSHRSQAEAGVDRLIGAGFRKEDISVLMQDNSGTKDFAHEKDTKAPEGTTAGVIAGGAIGGAFGLVVGLGAIVIPGLGPLLAAGPIIAALTGIGSGGIVGGIIGALVGMGIPEYEAKRYEGHVKSGGILASVHCDNREWVAKAKDALRHTGADDISSTSEAKADFASSDRPYSATAPRQPTSPLGALGGEPHRASAPAVADIPVRHSVAPAAAVAATAAAPAQAKTVLLTVPMADEADFRHHFQNGAGLSGTDYAAYAPAYRYGYHAANDTRFHGRSFEEIEPDLRSDYARHYPGDAWDRVKDSVRYGWSRVHHPV
jgi:hypothetical protein